MTIPTRAAITAVHGYLPPDLLTNAELARMVDTSDAWITERTGIKERHILKGEGLGTSHMAAEAVRGLLQKTGTKPEDIDLLICATTTPDMQFPSTANLICDMVGIRNIGSFDVQAACSGFLYSLTIAAQFIATGTARKVVVVGADKMSSIIDYTDRATCVLFGDGAGAVLLEPSAERLRHHGHADPLRRRRHDPSASEGRRQPHAADRGDGRQAPALRPSGRRRGLQIRHRQMAEVAGEIMARNNLRADMIDWLVPHQANKRIIESTAERMGLPMDKVMVTIHKYGNTTNATIPLCLWDYEPKLKRGDRMLLAAFGGGFTWAGVYVHWAYDGANAPKLNGKGGNGKGG